ncbi:MAG: RNA methyltransferase [Xanthomonadaceae bacterium]|nr:RNA methyltransferase [Xanthomonadaceae bacterium]
MRSTADPDLARLRFVLTRPSHPGNIGAAARALRTMGFERLALVAPARFPDPEATALAAGADAVLATAALHATLPDALADCTLALGLSARRRGVSLPELDPRAAAAVVWTALRRGETVALVFGNERTGLENDELARCHVMVRIPSVDDFSSLNLAQAVQVMAYELRMVERADAAAATTTAPAREPPAGGADMERFFDHLFAALHTIDFHKGRAPITIEQRLRKLFLRAKPDARELRVLHGILSDAERMARLAGRATSEQTAQQGQDRAAGAGKGADGGQ